MNNLAIIPARGGSKRIPKKNIRDFLGKPIIGYVIDTVLKCDLFDEIMVSTDDRDTADIATKLGANVPFLRSKKNANDFATLSDVIIEVLEHYKASDKYFDNVCCILPTAALLTPERITESYQLFISNDFKTLIPVTKFAYPIQRSLVDRDGLLKFKEPKHLKTRSQDLENHYHDSGQFYWIRTKDFLIEKEIFTNRTGYIELKEYEAQDVDTPEDWKMLEIKYKINI